MKLFSMDWFLTEKQKELQSLKVEEQKIKNELLEKQLHKEEDPIHSVKPYRRIILTNEVLTIVLTDGSIITKSNATKDDYDKATNAKFEADLFTICSVPQAVEKGSDIKVEIEQKAARNIDLLIGHEDFEVTENSVYVYGEDRQLIKRSVPAILVNRFVEVLNKPDEYQSVRKFWLKCCLNPNAQSAEDLYQFLTYHHFKIDRHGNFYAYRRVVSRSGDNKDLIEFISNTYTKVKAVWKKKPSDYLIWKDEKEDNFILSPHGTGNPLYTFIGNLQSLYLDLPNIQKKNYTSAHTGEEDYKVGEVISMPRNDGDDNNSISCSKGYHAASKKYDYSSFGDTPILVIINPMDVLAVPRGEDGKLRTCRWFFASVLTNEEQHILDNEEFDVTDLGDVFEEKCLENMSEYVKNSFSEEVKRHTFTLSGITSKEVSSIITSLEEMKEVLNKRVVNV